MMALFGPSPIGNTDGHTHYVEMKAGKMYRQGTWVYPDKRKGSLYIYRNSDDLMHFCWRNRTTYTLEDDFIIFPGDCTYSRVKECETGRVYVLRFENSTVRMFYWLQEPNTDRDDEHCRRINYLLNHPPAHHNTFTSPFNITQTQLSRIFGPDVAAQLSAIMMNEDNNRFGSRSGSESRRTSGSTTKHDTTPSPEVAVEEKEQTSTENRRKSALKTETAENSKKTEKKSVTILEDVKIAENETKNQTQKKNIRNKGKVSSNDETYIDVVDEDDECDQGAKDESYTDDDDNTK